MSQRKKDGEPRGDIVHSQIRYVVSSSRNLMLQGLNLDHMLILSPMNSWDNAYLTPVVLKVHLEASGISITWGFVRDANSQATPKTCEI